MRIASSEEGIIIVPSYKVYVAGGSHEIARCEDAIQALKDLGHTVVHNWPAMVRAVGSANPADATDDMRHAWAEQDLDGVAAADILWLLMPDREGFGAAVELGYAIGSDTEIIVSGPHQRSIFTVYADRVYPTDLDALKAEFMLGVPDGI